MNFRHLAIPSFVLLSLTTGTRADQVTLAVLHDTCIVQDAADRNFGARAELLASNNSSNGSLRRFCLLRFDLSGLAGQFATIDSMTLKLRLRLSTNPVRAVPTTGQIMDVFRIAETNAGWVEGVGLSSGTGTVVAEGSSTYRAKADSTVPGDRVLWTGATGLNTAGTDYFATAMGSTLAFDGTHGYDQGTVIDIPLTASGFTLTEMVNDWIADGHTNAGLLIRGRSGSANGQIFFDSNETPLDTDPGRQPAQLVITYTPGGGDPYTLWARANNLSGADIDPTSNPDNDGALNLLEFALDGNPQSGASDGKMSHAVTDLGDEQAFTLTIPVRNGAVFSGDSALTATRDGVQYVVQASADLAAWTLDVDEVTPALTAGLPALNTGWSYRTFRVAGAVSAYSRVFFQVAVSQAP